MTSRLRSIKPTISKMMAIIMKALVPKIYKIFDSKLIGHSALTYHDFENIATYVWMGLKVFYSA